MIDTIFLSLIALSLIFGQIARIQVGSGIQFYILELFVVLHIGILLFRVRNIQIHRSRFVRIGVLWFGYVCMLLVVTSFGKSSSDNLRALLYVTRIGIFALYATLTDALQIPSSIAKRIWHITSLIIPVMCLVQYLFMPDLRLLQQYGWDPHMYRAVGLYLDPPILGTVLGILFISAMFEKRKVAMILNYLAVIFLFSRSTYLSIFIVVISYVLKRKQWVQAIVWVLFFGLSLWLAPMTIPRYSQLESAKIERVSTVLSRRVEIEAGLRAWMNQPVFGFGFNRVAEYKTHHPEIYGKEIATSHAASAFHSFWVTQLATTGIVGVLLLIYWYTLAMRKSEMWFLVLVPPALIGLFDNVFFHPFVLYCLLLHIAYEQRERHSTSMTA